ncbi:superoxide dismutase [Candidatus Carsonella ruddii HT isolate Thao2000]|uniref:Superoxide dismutase n=1 Tax=Candidatus Carsonella ruddii HT isolate Thao2000 TaxID=1202539 RepID=J3Z1J6_CARRU|nr:Fe-Mn family superoxide dismutase [Candidatus Carsonella ruddii]AFP84139.1 superoxide dismutase [Candidatus Carsonella ruddii HT isolate Thao2000]
MLNLKKKNYKKNIFLSENQFKIHENIFFKYRNDLNNYLVKNNINVKNKFELIDFLYDLPEKEKNIFSQLIGSYLNHEYYFNNIIFDNINYFGEIKNIIIKNFKNFENFKYNFLKNFINFNGWGWLVINNNKIFMLKTYENNNPLFSINLGGFNSVPLICIDLHEHSYFLDYLDNKELYIKNFLNYINWFEIENRLQNYFLNK